MRFALSTLALHPFRQLFLSAVLCIIYLLFLPPLHAMNRVSDEELLAIARDGMAANLQSIESLSVEVTEFETQSYRDEHGKLHKFDQKRVRFIILEGDKCYQSVQVFDREGSSWDIVYDKTMSFDGTQTRKYYPRQDIGTIEPGNTLEFPAARDMFCGYRIFHTRQLSNLLDRAASVVVEEGDVGKLLHVTVPGKEGVFDVWLAAEKGFLISAMEATDNDGRLAAERRNTSIAEVGGAWFITEMEEVIFSRDEAGDGQRRHIQADIKTVNQPIPDSTFRLIFPEPTLVKDDIRGVQYRVGQKPLTSGDGPSSRRSTVLLLVIANVAALFVGFAFYFWRRMRNKSMRH